MFSRKKSENIKQMAVNTISEKKSGRQPAFQFVDNRQEGMTQRKLQALANNSRQVQQVRAYRPIHDNNTYQLKKTKVDVTGITHTVHPLAEEEQSIEGELLISDKKHFLYNEVRELSEPEKVWIETEDVILSRRGPNQEIFYGEDLSGPKYYCWYGVLSGTERPGGKTGEYLREDTFNLLPRQIPGRVDGLTAKADVNSLRLGAEALIARHYPIPMSKSSIGKVFIDTPDAYWSFAVRYFEATTGEKYDKGKHEEAIKGIAKTNALTELGEIHINASKADFGTFIHELIHFYGEQEGFVESVCAGTSDGFNEGVTEYFARKVTAAEGIDRSGKYSKEVSFVNEVVKVVGEKALYEAYFLGKNDQLIDLLKRNGFWPVNK